MLIGAGTHIRRRRRHQRVQNAEDARAVAGAIGEDPRAAEAARRRRRSRWSPRFTAMRSAADSNSPWPVTTASPPRTRRSDSRKCCSASFPGAGGTQRLPRLCGAELALEMCTDGKPVPAPKAKPPALSTPSSTAICCSGAMRSRRIGGGARDPQDARHRDRRRGAAARRRGVPARARALKRRTASAAPFAAIDAIEAAMTLPFDAGSRARTRAVRRLRHLHRIEGAAPSVLRRARSRQGPGRAEGHAAPSTSSAPPSSAPARWAAASP